MATISLGDFRPSADGVYTFINDITREAYEYILEDYEEDNSIYTTYEAYTACEDEFSENKLEEIDFVAIANAINFNNKQVYYGRI